MTKLDQLIRFNTVALPASGANSTPQMIASAPEDRAVRVALKNVSGAAAIISYPSDAVTGAVGAAGSAVFILLPGDNEVFVLPGGTAIFGLSLVAGAVVSAATS